MIHNGKKGFSEKSPATTTTGTLDVAAVEQAHKRSQFVLEELGSPWPRIEDMKKSARSEWSIPAIKHRITEVKKEHRQQLAKVMKYQEHEYSQMIADEYSAFDAISDWSANEVVESLFRMEHSLQTHQSDDFISNLRYSHLVALRPLYETLQQLLMLEERAKQQRARRFPKTWQAWRAMDTRDAKLKVAKFLMMDKMKQEDMILRETDWRADRGDIDKAILEFHRNVMFSEEVKTFVKDNQTTDPRLRG